MCLIFYHDQTQFMNFGEKATDTKCHFDHNMSKVHTLNVASPLTVSCWDGIIRFLYDKVTLFCPFLQCILWKGAAMHSPHSKAWAIPGGKAWENVHVQGMEAEGSYTCM